MYEGCAEPTGDREVLPGVPSLGWRRLPMVDATRLVLVSSSLLRDPADSTIDVNLPGGRRLHLRFRADMMTVEIHRPDGRVVGPISVERTHGTVVFGEGATATVVLVHSNAL